jgi:nitrogen fixation protein NifX
MNVALTTSDGVAVDVSFSEARHYQIWQIEPNQARFLLRSSPLASGLDEEEAADVRATAVAGCALVWALEVDDLSTAKLLGRSVMALSTRRPQAIREVVERLQQALRSGSSPWLRRAMAREAEPAVAAG